MESQLTVEMILRHHDLTVEEVLSLPLFANFTVDEAEDLILTVKKFSIIVFNAHQKLESDDGKSD
ncbi:MULTISPECIES: hypothetical protein [Pedobacter]|uniref:Uncharacterized protein n=1 Tax=Pedobacter suwonensis TaxID=332999 RepID=A0A1I0TT09_9SPHI|nr:MULTISPECIES: hypothetical protein [Pedobacter]SFA54925.1 hypothetical protein SAMN04488511_11444 [Pedobacter suwonensis]